MFQKTRSLLSLLLVCSLLLACLPAPALAADGEKAQSTAATVLSDEDAGSDEAEAEPAAVEVAADVSQGDISEKDASAEESSVATSAPETEEASSDEKEVSVSASEEDGAVDPAASAETTWITASDSTEVARLIQDNWREDYFQEAVVDPRRNRVTLDGETVEFSEAFDGVTEAEAEALLTSADEVEAYFADTAYEVETQSDGTVSVTAPYQTCRVVLTTEDLTEDYGAETVLEYTACNEYVLQFATAEETQAAYEQIVADYGAESCYVDQVLTADDLFLSDETAEATTTTSWGAVYMGLDTLKAEASSANDAVTVAIVDSGIDADNAFFEGRTITADSYDFLAAEDEDPTALSDPYGHGTHVAGIITECTPDNVELMVLRVLDDSGNGTLLLINIAIQYALDHGADVINLSLGIKNPSGNPYTYLDNVIQAAYEAGVPACCAAGNSKTDVFYPASNEQTLAVSAINSNGVFASSFSNYGEEIDFCAPGVSIVSARSGGGTTSKDGTSMSAAYLTAAMTYAITACPDATVDELYSVLQSCATDLGDEGKDDYYGWGCVTQLSDLFVSLRDLDLTVTLSQTNYTYDGTAQEPSVTVTDAGGDTMTEGTDYIVSYSDNTNAGTASVIVTGIGKYTGSLTTNFTISAVSLSTYIVSLSSTNYTYNGSAKKPTVTVKDADGNTLTKGTDYTVTYSNNTNVGTATVTVTGIGNYIGTVTKTFTIAKASQTVTASAGSSSIYAGKTTTITASGKGTITYSSSDTSVATVSSKGVVTGKKPGTVTITVKAAATTNYKATSKTVKITVKLNKTTISSLTNTSSGITVKWSKVTGASGYYIYRNGSKVKTISSGSTVSYTDTGAKTNGTKYQYKIYAYYGTTKSATSATKTTYYVSRPTISCLKNVKTKKMTVKWGKNSKVTGYQIQYSTSSSFSSGNKTVTVSSYKTVSKTISSLTKNKKYYVRVRAYKTVSGTKYYSAWSSTKNVKISK